MVTNPMILLPLIGLVAGIGVLVMTMLELGRERAEAQAAERPEALATSTLSGDKRTRRLDQALAASPALRRAVEVTADLAQRRGALGSVERLLRAADVPVRPAEMILVNMFAAVVVPIAALLLTGSPTKTILAFVLAAGGPILTLRFAAKRRTKRFNAQLPDALTTLAGSLRAGRSVGQALAVMSQELAAPMGRELRKIVAEVRLGRSLTESLEDAADRVASEDFRWAVLAMQIQGEVGGNLAELLDQVAATMRERSRMKGEVKALTAEGRASALMLVIMVPGLGLAMSVMNPDYMRPLWETSTGHILLGVSAVMITGGYLWMNSMVKIDVSLFAREGIGTLLAIMAALAAGGLVATAGFVVVDRVSLRTKLREIDDLYKLVGVRDQELMLPFTDRVASPVFGVLTALGRRFSPAGRVEQMRVMLRRAGRPDADTDRYLAIRVLSIIAAPFVAYMAWNLFASQGGLVRLAGTAVAVACCTVLPSRKLRSQVESREGRILRQLPDVMDLLVICMEAGLGFTSAVSRAVANIEGELSDEFALALAEMKVGASRADALLGLADRVQIPEVRSFVTAIRQADQFGVSVSTVLRDQSEDMRISRKQRAQEKAMKAPVKMLIPMVFCIFPPMFIIVIGPAALSISGSGF